MRAVWVVQDQETGRFLGPVDGDVGEVRLLSDAGRFDSQLEAVEVGRYHLEFDAVVFGFWEH